MSLHCPSCGAADDGTANGYADRAFRAEAVLRAIRDRLKVWRYAAPGYHTDDVGDILVECADDLEQLLGPFYR